MKFLISLFLLLPLFLTNPSSGLAKSKSKACSEKTCDNQQETLKSVCIQKGLSIGDSVQTKDSSGKDCLCTCI